VTQALLSLKQRIGGIREFARGGEGIISSPTLLVNARTGVPFASVAEHGPEPFAFGGTARGAGGDTVIVRPIVINGREIGRVVDEIRGPSVRRGYGRRR
jgi:hypothetical protein